MTRKITAAAAAAILLSIAGSGAIAGSDETETASDMPPTRLLMPIMNPSRGRQLFVDKGCVTCHAVNGMGGEDAAPLDADEMGPFVGIYDLVAKMWSNAPVMIPAQEEELGEQIQLTGDELADLVAFLHDDREQAKLTPESLTPEQREMLEQGGHDDDADEDHDN